MANVGSLVVDLRANSAAFIQEMEKSRAATERLGRSITTMSETGQRLLDGLGRAAVLFGVSLSVGALVDFTRQAVEMVGGLGELAEQLGVSTGALQVFRFAAAQNGVSVEQLETGLIRLNDAIGNAARGNDDALKTFNELGVRILDSAGHLRTTEQIINDVADGLTRIEDPARRAAAANDLFGRAGARLLPLLTGGSEGLRQFAEAARAAGAVLGDDLIQRLDAASDAMARNRLIALNWGAVFADHIIRYIRESIEEFDRITNAVERFGRALRSLLPAGAQGALGGPAVLAQALQQRRQAIDDEIAQISTPGPNQPRGSALQVRLARLRAERAALIPQIEAAERQLAESVPSGQGPDFGGTGARPSVTTSVGARNPVGVQAGRQAGQEQERQARAFDQLLRSLNPLQKAQQEYLEQTQRLDEAQRAGLVNGADYDRILGELQANYGAARDEALGLTAATDRTRDSVSDLIQAFEGFGRSSAKSIADMIVGLDQANFSIGRIVQTLASGILEKLIYERITGPLTRIAGTFLDNIFGSIFGGNAPAFAPNELSYLQSQGVTGTYQYGIRVPLRHGGGLGAEGGPFRAVDAAAFAGAPRFHGGKAPWGAGEMPAIIKPEEGVFTPGQMRALGPRSDMVVNIIDQRQGGAPPVETRSSAGPNGQRMLDVLIRDRVNTNADNGGLDQAMQRNFGLSRTPVRRS